MEHNEQVRRSFTVQAEGMAAYPMSKAEYTNELIRQIAADGTEQVLEAAAGTCICARALAPYVRDIVCLDLTEAMLAQGRKLAAEAGLCNLSFVTGDIEALPFADERFDLVITRLSLHHLIRPEKAFSELRRVLKRGGRLVIWDMAAPEEPLRDTRDAIERLRDPSHVRTLSRDELERLFDGGFTLQTELVTPVPVTLQSWMDLTGTPPEVQRQIVSRMEDELAGGAPTGFFPWKKDKQLGFDHHWLLIIGKKD